MRILTAALIFILVVVGCFGLGRLIRYNWDTCVVLTPEGKIRVPSYHIGKYKPDPKKYGYQVYNDRDTRNFLAALTDRYKVNDIIAVDQLKYQLHLDGYWAPYPNPPMPVYEEGEDKMAHFKEYAEWIDDHPHFGYPPLPLEGKY